MAWIIFVTPFWAAETFPPTIFCDIIYVYTECAACAEYAECIFFRWCDKWKIPTDSLCTWNVLVTKFIVCLFPGPKHYFHGFLLWGRLPGQYRSFDPRLRRKLSDKTENEDILQRWLTGLAKHQPCPASEVRWRLSDRRFYSRIFSLSSRKKIGFALSVALFKHVQTVQFYHQVFNVWCFAGICDLDFNLCLYKTRSQNWRSRWQSDREISVVLRLIRGITWFAFLHTWGFLKAINNH